MKPLFFLLLISMFAGAQTKQTVAGLKAKTSASVNTMYYTLSGTTRTYWKWELGKFDTTENVIFAKIKTGAFVKYTGSQKPIIPPPVYLSEAQSHTVYCPTGSTGVSVGTVAAGLYTSTISQADANNKAFVEAVKKAEAGLQCVINPPKAFESSAQTKTEYCADGKIGSATVTIPQGAFSSTISQADADNKASSEATRQAKQNLVCTEPGPVDSDTSRGFFNTNTSWGSMEEGSNILYLTKPMGARVGEELVIGLPSGKTRGKIGPGGSYPEKIYNTIAELRRDTTQPLGSRAAALDTPGIFRYNKPWWQEGIGSAIDKIVPFALYGNKILKIENGGLKLTMEKESRITVKNVRVTPDETKKMFDLIINTKNFDAKANGFSSKDTLWFGSDIFHWQPISPNSRFPDGWRPHSITISGNGMVWTSLPGTIPVGIQPENGLIQNPNIIRDLTIAQNGNYEGLSFYRAGAPTTGPWEDVWQPSAAFAGLTSGSATTVFKNCIAFNPVAYGFMSGRQDSIKVFISDENTGYFHYKGWAIKNHNDTTSNAEFYANGLYGAYELERGTNAAMINCKAINGVFAMNSSTNASFIGCTQVFTAGSADRGNKGNPPAFSINNRIGNGGWDKPTLILNHTIKYEGFPYSAGVTLRDFIIEGNGVNIINATIEKPDIAAPWTGNTQGAIVLYGGDDLLIDNMTVRGGKMARNWGCAEQTTNAAQFDLRGKRVVIKNSRGLQFIAAPSDAIIQNTQVECPIKRIDYE